MDMKKGVSSPAKGWELPSVVFPTKLWSATLGAAGLGVKPPSLAWTFPEPAVVVLWLYVPFWKRISTRKFGSSDLYGLLSDC